MGGAGNRPQIRATSPQLRVRGGERGHHGDPGVSFGTHPVQMAAWCQHLQHLQGTLLSQLLFELSFHKQLRRQQTQRLWRGRARVSGRFVGGACARILDLLALSPCVSKGKCSPGLAPSSSASSADWENVCAERGWVDVKKLESILSNGTVVTF